MSEAGGSKGMQAPAASSAGAAGGSGVRYEPVAFADLAGWGEDDHLAAFKAFQKSCGPLLKISRGAGAAKVPVGLVAACVAARAKPATTKAAARAFFEAYFTPHRVVHAGGEGLLTGYYEPLIKGARAQGQAFQTPVYRRPADLVNLVDESQRGAKADAPTHARQAADGSHEAYATRAEIEMGALAGQGLELMWFEDPVDVFFMQVQGSARIELTDGTRVRITYDGKNGHPYTSIGRRLIDQGVMREDEMSLAALAKWLRADPDRARAVMRENRSYVFFRELSGAEGDAAMGVFHIPLTPGRSLAVDAGHHAIGSPVWVAAPGLKHAPGAGASGFRRLMIAQDVGSAIRGPERGDIFFGSGHAAGRGAGITKHPGNFTVLLPAAAAPGVEAGKGEAGGSSGPVRAARQ